MKLLKVLALSALFTTTAYAQVAVTPTAPQPPTIITQSPNAADANQVATTNKVYIDQAGQNVNVNVVQTGTGNDFGNVTDPVTLRGDNQTVISVQTGNNNKIYMYVDSDIGSAVSADITLQQIGNNNEIDIRCGLGANVNCDKLDINAKFTGNYNTFDMIGSGTNIRNSMDIAGNYNTFKLDAMSSNGTQTLKITGDYNNFNMTQTGMGGTFGHSLWADFTGSSNVLTAEQYGASETVINILSVGSNGTFNIKTGH